MIVNSMASSQIFFSVFGDISGNCVIGDGTTLFNRAEIETLVLGNQ